MLPMRSTAQIDKRARQEARAVERDEEIQKEALTLQVTAGTRGLDGPTAHGGSDDALVADAASGKDAHADRGTPPDEGSPGR